MAVSGRKPADFKESLSMGLTEDFEICCDPCLSHGDNTEAKGFCVKCQENLCKPCLDAHSRFRVQKHQVEDKPRARASKSTAKRDQSRICTELCAIHSDEIIKFYCRNHETLGCSDCITLNHRNCDIDYIPDICSVEIKSNEFKTTVDEVTEKLNQSDDFRMESDTSMAATRENITDTIKQIEDFQKKMNEELNTLKNKLIQDMKLAESTFDKHVHETLCQNDRISSELKSIKANLETYQTAGQDAQAFTTMKQTQSRLITFDIAALKCQFLAGSRTYKFEPNEALVDILSTSDGLGRIVASVETQPVLHTLHSLTHDKDIKVRSKSDRSTCNITGCALLSSGKLVVTDWDNKKVKIVDVTEQSVTDECILLVCPCDVAVHHHDQVAVTLPLRREIRILKTRGKLNILRNIEVNRRCYGIACHQDLLCVVCQDPDSVLVLDMQGAQQRDVLLQSALNETLSHPRYITISKNLQEMYISDMCSNIVVSLTVQEEVNAAVYKNDELKTPLGMTLLEDGSLLVCCRDNGTIHHISADLTQGHKAAGDITNARSICYESNNKTVYVGSAKCEHIHVVKPFSESNSPQSYASNGLLKQDLLIIL